VIVTELWSNVSQKMVECVSEDGGGNSRLYNPVHTPSLSQLPVTKVSAHISHTHTHTTVTSNHSSCGNLANWDADPTRILACVWNHTITGIPLAECKTNIIKKMHRILRLAEMKFRKDEKFTLLMDSREFVRNKNYLQKFDKTWF